MSTEGLNEESLLSGGELTREELDAVSELSNISMGAAGSSLSLILGTPVDVSSSETQEAPNLSTWGEPFAGEGKTLVKVQYTSGFEGTSLFVLKNSDAQLLLAKVLGTEPDATAEISAGDLAELMNQLLNAAATSLASVIHEPVEIGPPEVAPYSDEALRQAMPQLATQPLVTHTVQFGIAEASTITLLEIKSVSETRTQVGKLLSETRAAAGAFSQDEAAVAQPVGVGAAQGGAHNIDPVTVRPVQFSAFDNQPSVFGEENKNLELVMDITLNLTVELGRTELSIKEVLELTRGSVIELDRVAGEPVDLMANGKLIAKGEVVVIEDNFGLRITSIVSPAERLRGLS
ncbi:MAG TPA: flagellar motor switch phosphatase FliY [Oculatellaceae cyanobacterium]|jgi:flagellar motor switch protein FliN/FliY